MMGKFQEHIYSQIGELKNERGLPYVFVPPKRYDRIQQNRQEGKWTVRHGKCPVNSFSRQLKAILTHAKIDQGEFHDLRRTCLTMFLLNGPSEYDVMNLASHAEFETTRRFYLAVREDLLQRARDVSAEAMNGNFVAHLLLNPLGPKKGLTGCIVSCYTKTD